VVDANVLFRMSASMNSVVIAEILRSGHVESRHTGAFVVADTNGRIVQSGGDPERAVFPRSAIKALQALPLVASGAADRFGLSHAELALACASHSGAPVHAVTALSMLRKAGRDEACLECGTHWPTSERAARALAADGARPGPRHNNCSGKHAGFVCLATAAGWETEGYVAPDHRVMRVVRAAVQAVTGARQDASNMGIDGCSIPTYAMPLVALATGFARFGTGIGMPAGFDAAAVRLRTAVAAHPAMVAGQGRFDTVVMAALGEAIFIKIGAEGIQCGALPSLGLGFALKCDDGGVRAAEAASASLLRGLLGPATVLDELATVLLKNWNGFEVGAVRGMLS
jgi:L-asparaginase II